MNVYWLNIIPEAAWLRLALSIATITRKTHVRVHACVRMITSCGSQELQSFNIVGCHVMDRVYTPLLYLITIHVIQHLQ